MNDCLLLVDLQNDYFPGGALELTDIEAAAARAQELLQDFRRSGSPVVHIRHVATRPEATFFLPDTAGVAIHSTVAPRDREAVVTKHYPNSFRDTELLALLRQRAPSSLVICGAMSHMCIDATTRAAFDLGFDCRVAADACATRDLQFRERTVAAADVHAAFMAALSSPYARVASTAEILADRRSRG